MFTGIIEEVGNVKVASEGTLIISCREIMPGTKLGDSIAVNGVDLTVCQMDKELLHFNVMPETYRRSNLAGLASGRSVNLERALTLSTRISGHLVRGVVEARGALTSRIPEADAVLTCFSAPTEIMPYIVVKGPVAIDGVSLTVVARDDSSFTVSLVQYTQDNTNLMDKEIGDEVNLETDIIARYVEQLLSDR